MSYFLSSSNGLPVTINTVTILEDGREIYSFEGVNCAGDLDYPVNFLRRNFGDLSYKNGAQLLDLLRYRLSTGTNDLTQNLKNGREIIFG